MLRSCAGFNLNHSVGAAVFTALGVQEWSAEQICDQTGKVALVTGALSGVGAEVAKELATHGCRVVLAGRTKEAVEAAVRKLKASRPTAAVESVVLDLASLTAVEAAATDLKKRFKALHLLVHCAAVFSPKPGKTDAGLDTQLAVNAVGPAQLTQLLLPLLKAGKGRVVSVTCPAAGMAALPAALEDLGGEKVTESGPSVYALSKLLLLLHAKELGARLAEAGVTAYAVHPGRFVATPLLSKADPQSLVASKILPTFSAMLAVSPAAGALPVLYAATVPDLPSGCYAPSDVSPTHVGPWGALPSAATAENSKAVYDALLKLVAAKGGKLELK